jgi:hypothetical protein
MASTEAELEADYDEGGEGAEELEALKKQLKQMEEEADKLKKIDNQIGSPGTQILPAPTRACALHHAHRKTAGAEGSKDADARPVFVGNVSAVHQCIACLIRHAGFRRLDAMRRLEASKKEFKYEEEEPDAMRRLEASKKEFKEMETWMEETWKRRADEFAQAARRGDCKKVEVRRPWTH